MFRKLREWDGHFSIGPITVFGANAMHWAVNVRTKLGYFCFHPPVKNWPWKFYISKNATPWAAVFAIGPGIERDDRDAAALRFSRFLRGLPFSTEPGTTLDEVVK